MIFNSFEFILIYLPLTFLAFAAAERIAGWQAAFKVIVVASLIFYGQWSLGLLALLMVSVISNYVIGKILIQSTKAGKPSVGLMIVGIIGNLAALGYFKYTNFFLDVANQVTGGGYSHLDIILPVGISFYTFIQIGFLVEAHSGQAEQQSFTRYLTFATFFPCVTAGPLVLQREIFDQMNDRTDSALDFRRIAAGVAMFSMGLFKKVILADSIAPYANGAFNGVAAGQSIDALTAWAGSTAYALQLYFDFSGYTDMAIGLGGDLRHHAAPQLQLAVQSTQHFRLLAALAHVNDALLHEVRLFAHGDERHAQGRCRGVRPGAPLHGLRRLAHRAHNARGRLLARIGLALHPSTD